jgi:hypothetical protein
MPPGNARKEGAAMSDTCNQKPIRVMVSRSSGPYLKVPQDQLDKVRELLQAHGVGHWADHLAISIDGRPATVRVYLDKKCDPDQVQQILDAAL